MGPTLSWPESNNLSSDDWSAFIRAYAQGQWDPYKIPLPPRSARSPQNVSKHNPGPSVANRHYAGSAPARPVSIDHIVRTTPTASPASSTGIELLASAGVIRAIRASTAFVGNFWASSSQSPSPPSTPSIASRRGANTSDLHLSPARQGTTPPTTYVHPDNLTLTLPRRPVFRSAGSDPLERRSSEHSTSPKGTPAIDDGTAAATVRWAGAGVDVAPLVLPSPEFELVDPMRRVSLQSAIESGSPQIPERRPASALAYERPPHTFWNLLGSPDHLQGRSFGRPWPSNLEVITGSPVTSPNERPASGAKGSIHQPLVWSPKSGRKSLDQGYFQAAPSSWGSSGSTPSPHSLQNVYASPSAASVPVHLLQKGLTNPDDDYFGPTAAYRGRQFQTRTPELRRVAKTELQEETAPVEFEVPDPSVLWDCAPRTGLKTAGAPANASPSTPGLHEAWYHRMGYLLSPMPPDEAERRKALHK